MRLSGFAQIVRRAAATPAARMLLAALVLAHWLGAVPEPVRILGLSPPTFERTARHDALAVPRAPLAAPAAENAALPEPAPVPDGDGTLVAAATDPGASGALPPFDGGAAARIPAPAHPAFRARAPPAFA